MTIEDPATRSLIFIGQAQRSLARLTILLAMRAIDTGDAMPLGCASEAFTTAESLNHQAHAIRSAVRELVLDLGGPCDNGDRDCSTPSPVWDA